MVREQGLDQIHYNDRAPPRLRRTHTHTFLRSASAWTNQLTAGLNQWERIANNFIMNGSLTWVGVWV